MVGQLVVGQLVGWSVGTFKLWLVSWYFLTMVGQLVVGQLGVGQLVGWSVLLVPFKYVAGKVIYG